MSFQDIIKEYCVYVYCRALPMFHMLMKWLGRERMETCQWYF
jgi:hypothetical protein